MDTHINSDIVTEKKFNPSPDTLSQIEFDERGLALGNHIIMKKIVNYLDDKDLISWYDSCMFVKVIIDGIGDSIWMPRLNETWDTWEIIRTDMNQDYADWGDWRTPMVEWDRSCRSCSRTAKEQFITMKTQIEQFVKHVKKDVEEDQPSYGSYIVAGSLAYHGLLGSIENLRLTADCPDRHEYKFPEYLAALVGSVLDWVSFYEVDAYAPGELFTSGLDNLGPILANIKCRELRIMYVCARIGTESTEAVVRAMQSGVEKVELHGNPRTADDPIDIAALTKYDGEGTCEEIFCDEYILKAYREEIKNWSQRINWDSEFHGIDLSIGSAGFGIVPDMDYDKLANLYQGEMDYDKDYVDVVIKRKSSK